MMKMCIKAPRVPLAMLSRASGWAAVDAQLAACERAVVGSEWREEDERAAAMQRVKAGVGAGEYTRIRLIESFLRTMRLEPVLGDDGSRPAPPPEYYDSIFDTDALVDLGGSAYPVAVIRECRREAREIFQRECSQSRSKR